MIKKSPVIRKKKVLKKIFVVSPVIYPYDILFLIDLSNEEVKTELESRMFKELWGEIPVLSNWSKTNNGKCTQFSNGSLAIRLKHYPKYPQDHGTISHEIFHAVTLLLDRLGIQFDIEKSDEAYAYLIGYITEQFYKEISYEMV